MQTLTNAATAASTALRSFGAKSPTTAGRGRRIKPAYVGIAIALVVLGIAAWFWASRESSIQTAVAWGLPGVWQQDCKAPVSARNPQYKYSIEDGKILLRRDFGRNITDASELSDVERISGEIRYAVHFTQLGVDRNTQVSRHNVLAKSADGRIRTVSNTEAGTGDASVVGGIRARDSKPTPWLTRCGPG